jgi:Predicted membrane protein
VFFLSFSINVFSQKAVRQELRKGNKEYRQEKYTEAEIDYRKALEANARSTDAAFNLGNALFKQTKMPEALEQYQASLSGETDKVKLASSWHNIGNISMAGKDYAKSIEAYKQALRNNPADNETRYNLALAQKLLEEQENEDQSQDQNQEQQQEQEQQQDQQPPEQQEQQQNPNEMSQENAEQILDAMMQNEKNTQEKVKEQQMRQQKQRKTDKNW